MNIFDTLKGKTVKVESDMGPVELTIAEVKEEHRSVETGESNASNDWWPETREWVEYKVTFTNGKSKIFQSLSSIDIIE